MDVDISRLLPTPTTQEDTVRYLQEAMPLLVEALKTLTGIQEVTGAPLGKPREGMLRYSDGTWDADELGSGAGFYRYSGGAWVYIG